MAERAASSRGAARQPGPTTGRRQLLQGGAAAILGAGAATLAGTTGADATPARSHRWAPSWYTAQSAPTAADTLALGGFTDRTVRAVLRMSAGGRQLRLRFANPFSDRVVAVGPVTVARRPAGTAGPSAAVDPASLRPVTFGGEPDSMLVAGAEVLSDPIELPVRAGGDLVVSAYLPGPTGPVAFHRNIHATSYVSVAGAHTGDGATAYPTTTSSVFLLTAVEVTGAARGLAILGDSITEGVGTPNDANLRWPDQLAARMPGVAVANLGISGNRVLLDDDRFGPSAQRRFDRDVAGLSGVDTVLVFIGINDIQQPPQQSDPAAILAGHRQLALRARARGLRVVGATITPFEGWLRYTPAREAVRRAVNAELRRGRIFDALVDFDAAVRDPDRPTRLRPDYASPDGLHPNAAGAGALAAAVPVRAVFRS
ncbi:SGNH hydrolase [Actinocatenispora thailandica]|uniref:SGNH hydrolase n=1 Tax=Actinocatenispora thailandica TaxID=227318 RepID=A0A7R7DVJ3_9ACTN|nr:SGNH/GDSL hydrolase family protein [Actinocatenispora thailandica]BCJ38638.1 SGNH hydrolase [Actinocatenispora thailandica]